MSRVVGLQRVINLLRSTAAGHAKGVARGLKLAAIPVLRASQRIVPVDLGTLKATGHIRHEGTGFNTVVIIGYGTDYGMYVHEDLDKAHGAAYNSKYAAEIRAKAKYWYAGAWRTYHTRGPNQQAKFLTKALADKKQEIVAIVVREANK